MPDQGLKSRIAAPLTSMLKTSSTESAEPRKGVVGVGSGGRNRAEPVGKHEVDGVDDGGGGHSSDSNKISSDAPKMMCPPAPCISRLRTSTSLDSSTSAIQVVVEYDGVEDGGRSGDFDRKFRPRLQYGNRATHLDAQDELINRLID